MFFHLVLSLKIPGVRHKSIQLKGEAQPIVSHLTGVATALASALADHVITTGILEKIS